MFKEPVEILPSVSYTACATLKVGLNLLLMWADKMNTCCLLVPFLIQSLFFSSPQGPDSHYGTKGLKKVTQESATGAKTTFFFFSSPGNNNGTSVEDGQIPEIIYYTWTLVVCLRWMDTVPQNPLEFVYLNVCIFDVTKNTHRCTYIIWNVEGLVGKSQL